MIGTRIIGLAGWSGAGKTTLATRLIPALNAQGLRVSTVKHAHHGFDMDRPGKDSHLHREAGAEEVLVASSRRWALLHELRDAEEPSLPALLARLSPVDIVIVEGFKRARYPKIEVHRVALGKPLLAGDDPYIRAIASEGAVVGATVPVLDLDDTDAVLAMTLHLALDLAVVIENLDRGDGAA